MGYMIVVGPCFICGRTFEYNAEAVPSMVPPGKTHAQREPVCGACMTRINAKRAEMDLPPHPIRADAYEGQEVG